MSWPLMIDCAELVRDEHLTAIIDALADAFRELSAGRTQTPPRTLIQTGPDRRSQLLVGSAAWERRGVAGVKVTTLTPDNPGRGLPLIHGIVILTDLDTGQVTALMDGAALTAVRTGAVAGLATRLCAPAEAGDLAMIGAGVQARALLRAMAAVRPIRSVRLYSRTRSTAAAFADWVRACPNLSASVVVCDDPYTAVHNAEIICTTTSTSGRTPLIEAGWVTPGAHLNVIGGTHEDAIEVDPALLGTALVAVEQRAAALKNAGEVRSALADGLIGVGDLHDLGALLNGDAAAAAGQTTVFRSVGLAIEDTAAAVAVYEALAPTGEASGGLVAIP
jgi:ornithine cyclodeaminase